jgi:CRP/FNR family transcriptional regulator, cyclic AMP receptor protein
MKKRTMKARRPQREPTRQFELSRFLSRLVGGNSTGEYQSGDVIFAQGSPCEEVCYLDRGKVKASAVSDKGKEAVVAMVDEGHFFGAECLAGRPAHLSTAAALGEARVVRFEKNAMSRLLQREQGFLYFFMCRLLARTVRLEEDLLDHLFNTSEKRLARVLLLLANFAHGTKTARINPKITQETLASMVGTTRSRINLFMRKFQKLGFIDYDGDLRIHRSLSKLLEGRAR